MSVSLLSPCLLFFLLQLLVGKVQRKGSIMGFCLQLKVDGTPAPDLLRKSSGARFWLGSGAISGSVNEAKRARRSCKKMAAPIRSDD